MENIMEKTKCKHLKTKIKMVITKKGILYGKQYKCKIKNDIYKSSRKLTCEKCPLQYNLFNE